MKKWLGRFALLVLGLVLAFGLLEILTRAFWKSLSQLDRFSSVSFVNRDDYEEIIKGRFIWHGRIGNIREFRVEITLNRLGFHDTEHKTENPEGAFRIVVAGDSFIEALQVPMDRAFHKVLESRIRSEAGFPIEVISLGKSGSGTGKNLERLQSLGLKFHPDLVILEFFSNDLIDDTPRLRKEQKEQLALRKKYIPELKDLYSKYLWLNWSRFNQVLALKLARIRENWYAAKSAPLDKYGFIPLNTLVYAEEFDNMWKAAWQRAEGFFIKARDLCRGSGAELLVISIPDSWRVGQSSQIRRRLQTTGRDALKYRWTFNKTDLILEDFLLQNGIRFLPLLPAFNREYRQTGQRLYYAYDMHLNENGHRAAAEAVFEFLRNNHLLSIRTNTNPPRP